MYFYIEIKSILKFVINKHPLESISLKWLILILQSKGPVHITPTDVQEKYLSLIREFFDKGRISQLILPLDNNKMT